MTTEGNHKRSESPWRLVSEQATLQSGPLGAVLDLAHPARGLGELSQDGSTLPAVGLLAVRATGESPFELGELQESYVRGCDLVASYRNTEARPVRTQIYWRVLTPASSSVWAGMELIVSVHTHLLDSQPRLAIVSTFTDAELLAVDEQGHASREAPESHSQPTWHRELTAASGDQVLLARPVGADWSFVQMVHPTDWTGAELRRDATCWQMVHQLFPEHLEKGIIRRARLLAAWIRRDGDLNAARQCRQRLLAEAPPLAT